MLSGAFASGRGSLGSKLESDSQPLEMPITGHGNHYMFNAHHAGRFVLGCRPSLDSALAPPKPATMRVRFPFPCASPPTGSVPGAGFMPRDRSFSINVQQALRGEWRPRGRARCCRPARQQAKTYSSDAPLEGSAILSGRPCRAIYRIKVRPSPQNRMDLCSVPSVSQC